MAYTKVNWQDSPSTATPITATNLNKMDNGIASADTGITTLTNGLNTTKSQLGVVSSLNTSNKTSAVAGINEVNTKVGAVSSLNTTNKTSAVAGINEVNAKVGTISNLNTSNKSSAAAGINEVNTKVGTLSNLNTNSKASIVSAMNEINSKVPVTTNTFVPIFRGSVTAGAFTYSQRLGSYYRLGRLVIFEIELTTASCISKPTGEVQITGLPIAAATAAVCQSVYVSDELAAPYHDNYRRIVSWVLNKNSKTLLGKCHVPDGNSVGLWTINFGIGLGEINAQIGTHKANIVVSGIFLTT